MNRQIKFRVWNKKTNNWVDGCAPSKTASCDGVNLFGETILLGAFMNGVSLEGLNDCEALQFTGLKDKNGKEIFEGDIVKSLDNIRQVFFASGCFEIDGRGAFCDEVTSNEPDKAYDLEIIGNIFENPELLK